MHQLISNLRAIAEPFIVLTTWLKYCIISPKSRVSNCYLMVYSGGGGGRFNPSFYRSSSSSAFRAFVQSLLFLVARSFLRTFQRISNAHLYQGTSPLPVLACVCKRASRRNICTQTGPFSVFRFDRCTYPYVQHNVSHRIPTYHDDCPMLGFLPVCVWFMYA